jgi:uncharacterized membrane protein YebE (DUF533 family)
MFKTVLKITAIAALGYVAFQVGRSWDEISADAAEIADDVVNGPNPPADAPNPPNPTVVE